MTVYSKNVPSNQSYHRNVSREELGGRRMTPSNRTSALSLVELVWVPPTKDEAKATPKMRPMLI